MGRHEEDDNIMKNNRITSIALPVIRLRGRIFTLSEFHTIFCGWGWPGARKPGDKFSSTFKLRGKRSKKIIFDLSIKKLRIIFLFCLNLKNDWYPLIIPSKDYEISIKSVSQLTTHCSSSRIRFSCHSTLTILSTRLPSSTALIQPTCYRCSTQHFLSQ